MKRYFSLKELFAAGFAFLCMVGILSCKKKTDPKFSPKAETLQLDSYKAGNSKAFQGGFVAGEGAAVVLGPVGHKVKLNKVLFLFGGTSTQTATGTLRIFKDNGNTAPGDKVHEMDFSLTTSDDSLRVLDLSSANLHFPIASSFRVLILMKNNGYPSVAADTDATIGDLKNWIYTNSSWMSSASLGLKGDWIIRAEIETEE